MPCGWEGNRRSSVALAMCHVTDNSGITTYGLMALEREMSTPPIGMSVVQFTLLQVRPDLRRRPEEEPLGIANARFFLQNGVTGRPSCHPTNSVQAVKEVLNAVVVIALM